MPVFRLLDQDHELTAEELATAPQSVLAEAAALAKPEEVINITSWREADQAVFKAGLARTLACIVFELAPCCRQCSAASRPTS